MLEIVPNWLKEAYLPQLISYKERNLPFVLYMACGGMIFTNLKFYFFCFILFN